LWFLLDKYVIKHFDKALHGFLERQLTISPKKLKIEIPFSNLILFLNRTILLHNIQYLFLLGDLIQMIQLFNGFGSFGFLLSERNVFIVELLKDVSRELAPKL
jgi:hypothetical protein